MNVPYGAMSGFSLASEIRFIACYYGVREAALRRWRRRSTPVEVEARQALYWRLTHERRISSTTVARLLHVADPKHVRLGAAKHAARIDEFRTTGGGVTRTNSGSPQ